MNVRELKARLDGLDLDAVGDSEIKIHYSSSDEELVITDIDFDEDDGSMTIDVDVA